MSESRFSFVSQNEVDKTRENTVPPNTKKHTLWSTNVYKQWAKSRNEEFEDFESENSQRMRKKYSMSPTSVRA